MQYKNFTSIWAALLDHCCIIPWFIVGFHSLFGEWRKHLKSTRPSYQTPSHPCYTAGCLLRAQRNPWKAFRIGTCVSLQTGTGQSEAPRQNTIVPQQHSSQLRVTFVTWYFINAPSPETHVSNTAALFLPTDFTAPCIWSGWHYWRLPAETIPF